MKGSFPAVLAGLMAAILALATALGLAKGGLHISNHEGDLLHLADIVRREVDGEWPHLDFVTPLGVLAYAPIAALAALGLPLGLAVIWAQALVGAVLLPGAFWVGLSRLDRGWACLFGAGVMGLAVALASGGPEPWISLSMHYNRWGWAIAFIVLAIAILPPRGSRPGQQLADGLALGLGLAALALIKATYLLACAPVAVLALALRRDGRALATALAAALAIWGGLTLVAGPGLWPAYLTDLLEVARTDMRPFPSDPFLTVIGGTRTLAGTLLYLAAVILARRGGWRQEGLLLLAAGPGLAYVTYQNHGNAPVWLFLLGILALALRRPGTPQPSGLMAVGWSALLLAAPIFLALFESPIRNFSAAEGEAVALLPGDQGLWMPAARALRVETRIERPLDLDPPDWLVDPGPEPTVFRGTELEGCVVTNGLVAWYRAISEDLAATGFAGHPAFVADVLSAYWLFGGVGRLDGGAPWYYGGLPGIEGAELLLVPQCVGNIDARRGILAAVEAGGYELTELRRTRDYIVLGIAPPAASAR
ncbi:hypothetical protein DSD19_00555 [Rhodovulum sp. BSW8]|uniref:hypothetical protein n=1 Tax=Rhodovulum sp. BSW8 TaxID=2259645 RepID=UPI000DE31B62|nr:hypothetical protein [Rhodovulum sp. BSW8]RBO54969.1 hypothetical protein DSD19_00555 [Rhodovulum sp. BSW8]